MHINFQTVAEKVVMFGLVGSLGTGILGGVVGAVSKFALPKLGFDSVCGVALTTVSRNAFKTAAVGCSIWALIATAIFLYLSCCVTISCGDSNYSD